MQERNGQPAMPGKWHKEPYNKRKYEELTDYAISESVSEQEAAELRAQLYTPLIGFQVGNVLTNSSILYTLDVLDVLEKGLAISLFPLYCCLPVLCGVVH